MQHQHHDDATVVVVVAVVNKRDTSRDKRKSGKSFLGCTCVILLCSNNAGRENKKLSWQVFFFSPLSFFLSLSLFYHTPTMSSTEYGSVPRSDEEAHTVEQTRWQKCRSHLGKHGHRIFIAWFIIILVAAVLTLSFHFSLIPSHHEQPAEGDDDLVNLQCTSDRSWLLTLLLSIFFGCFGKHIYKKLMMMGCIIIGVI